MRPTVAAFTDTYLPTVNGVTYTVKTWSDRWQRRGGRMDIVYPQSEHTPTADEYPVTSLPFPFYNGFRIGFPRIPDAVSDADIVHTHTAFGVGLGGLRLAKKEGQPLVTSFHTPTSEYAAYLTERSIAGVIGRASAAYEDWYLDHADHIVTPSENSRDRLLDRGVEPPVTIVPNGIDVDRFEPTETDEFRERFDLPRGPLIGYTGRHGYEKQLGDIIDATAGLDVTVVFGGDGPARAKLEEHAAATNVEVRFLGFLDREDLPAFYSALDVFAFPSPVETQGLVALEANACGTPVVGVEQGALVDTVDDGETGYHYDSGNIDAFQTAILRALDNRETLSACCLDQRDAISVEHSVDQLETVYEDVL
jgi:1,2-diacylglycerol 3-alpha-glucosyltransferase